MQKKRSLLLIGTMAVIGSMSAPTHAESGGGRRSYQSVNMIDFHTGAAVSGAATMFRSRNGLEIVVATSGLDQNAGYTIWWVIFNRPQSCVGGCGEDDLARPEVAASVLYATGFVTGADGVANVSARVEAGVPPDGVDVLLGEGLNRGRGLEAEVHLVVRSHGPLIPGMVDKQISTFDPTCAVCDDEQAAVFPPAQ